MVLWDRHSCLSSSFLLRRYRDAALALFTSPVNSVTKNSITARASSPPRFNRSSAFCSARNPLSNLGFEIFRAFCSANSACSGRIPSARAACQPFATPFISLASISLRYIHVIAPDHFSLRRVRRQLLNLRLQPHQIRGHKLRQILRRTLLEFHALFFPNGPSQRHRSGLPLNKIG